MDMHRSKVAIIIVFILSLSMLSIVPVSHASTPVVDYLLYETNAKCWSGYDGNSTIYMVRGITDTNVTGVNYTRAAQIVGSENASGYQTSENNTYGTPNILYLEDGSSFQMENFYNGKYLFVCLYTAFMGAMKSSNRSNYLVNNVELSVVEKS